MKMDYTPHLLLIGLVAIILVIVLFDEIYLKRGKTVFSAKKNNGNGKGQNRQNKKGSKDGLVL